VASRQVVPSLFPPPGYAHVTTVGRDERLVFTAGAVPLDRSGNLVGAGDLQRQTRAVLDNLRAALEAAGSGLEHVVQSRVYVVAEDNAELARVWDVVRASGLSDGPHCSTLLGVRLLGYTGQLVEIEAVAVAGGAGQPGPGRR
jgi:enamine deaminase RidA (YjgF/YER057c/UK114 family)